MTKKRPSRREGFRGAEGAEWLYPVLRPLAYAAGRAVVAACGGMQASGTEHVPRTGGALIVGNHLSVADPPIAALATPRPVHFLARRYLFDLPVLRQFILAMRAYPVDPQTGQLRALSHAVKVLRAGEALVMYPEGRCSRDGRLQPFQAGAALITWLAGAPVLPLAVRGTDRLIPVGKYFPQRLREPLVVRFGPPVDFSDLNGLPRPKWVPAAARRMHDAVAALLAPGETRPR